MLALMRADWWVQSRSKIRAEPWVGRSRPRRMRMAVVLPEPFGPRKPNRVPCLTWSVSDCMPIRRP